MASAHPLAAKRQKLQELVTKADYDAVDCEVEVLCAARDGDKAGARSAFEDLLAARSRERRLKRQLKFLKRVMGEGEAADDSD